VVATAVSAGGHYAQVRSNWTTLGGGKTFHPTFPPNWDLPRSWSGGVAYYPFAYWTQPNGSTAYGRGYSPGP
jgi:hypothetical protein